MKVYVAEILIVPNSEDVTKIGIENDISYALRENDVPGNVISIKEAEVILSDNE
jgi:hypothetical protein